MMISAFPSSILLLLQLCCIFFDGNIFFGVQAFTSPPSPRQIITPTLKAQKFVSFKSNETANKITPPTSRPNTNAILLSMSSPTDDDDETITTMSGSDQLLLGSVGTFASFVTFYSEFTLKTTGCGLPAGPFGLVGLIEGLSYLGVTGLAAYSIVTKVKTGSGLPAGPGGLLGAAEGLSFLAITAGLVVLILQITNFGYIPNAIPMEGGMCS